MNLHVSRVNAKFILNSKNTSKNTTAPITGIPAPICSQQDPVDGAKVCELIASDEK